jgi:hypothetical protein
MTAKQIIALTIGWLIVIMCILYVLSVCIDRYKLYGVFGVAGSLGIYFTIWTLYKWMSKQIDSIK